MSANVYVNSIKEVIAKDDCLSWRYVLTNREEDEGLFIEHWEMNSATNKMEIIDSFRIDLLCAKQVLEAGIQLLSLK